MKTSKLTGTLMVAPAVALLLLFFILPAALLLPASLCTFDIRMQPTFAGLANYRELWQSQMVRQAVSATVAIASISFVLVWSTSIVGGIILSEMKWRVRLHRMFSILSMLSGSAMSMFWCWLFMPIWGGLSKLWMAMGNPPLLWHASPFLARLSSSLVVWVWTFPHLLWTLSVLMAAVPQDLVDAAKVDGATSWQVFRYVSLPVLRRPLAYYVLGSACGLLQVYEAPYILWKGGPSGATRTAIMVLVQRMGNNYGLAAAFAVMFTLVLGAIGAMTYKLGEGR
jgi:multiple sugar transport system permease protein